MSLWVIFVAGTQATRRTFTVPVVVDNIHPDYMVDTIEPAEVRVTLSGLRRDFYLVTPAEIEVRLDAFLVGLGRRTFHISNSEIVHPEKLEIRTVSPRRIKLDASRTEPSSNAEGSIQRRGAVDESELMTRGVAVR